MKYMLWTVVLAATFVLSAVPAAAAEEEDRIPTPEEMEKLDRTREFRAREAEFEFQQSLRELELDKERAKLEQMRLGLRRAHKHDGGGPLLVLLLILVTHILLTVWVCKDMREQKIGRALWVPIALLTGVFGAILYAIVRNADVRRQGRAR